MSAPRSQECEISNTGMPGDRRRDRRRSPAMKPGCKRPYRPNERSGPKPLQAPRGCCVRAQRCRCRQFAQANRQRARLRPIELSADARWFRKDCQRNLTLGERGRSALFRMDRRSRKLRGKTRDHGLCRKRPREIGNTDEAECLTGSSYLQDAPYGP